MAESPKILQVTIGSFSCTLEGFEDPVETLIAVAEYFRGLAATDPDLLRVPSVPEVEELARGAEAAAREEAPSPFGGAAPTGGEAGLSDPEGVDAADGGAVGPEPEPSASSARPDPTGGEEGWFVNAAPVEPLPPEDAEAQAERRRRLAQSPDEDDEDLRRILARAEEQLSDPEAARRRETLAHLKAAVVATELDRAEEPGTEEGGTGFRLDFANIRPASVVVRPADVLPLRLVPAQRVDSTGATDPVAPGEGPRLPETRADEPGPGDPPADVPGAGTTPEGARAKLGGFASVASRLGAQTLADMLEAAAAWAAAVGEGEITQARLLGLAAEGLGREPAREEALRVLGTLLREGRIERREGGRFRVGPGTRFDPSRLAL